MFGSTVGFSRSVLFPVSPNPRWRLGRHLENSNGNIYAADHAIYFVFGSRMGWVSGSNCANFGLTKFNRYVGENNAR